MSLRNLVFRARVAQPEHIRLRSIWPGLVEHPAVSLSRHLKAGQIRGGFSRVGLTDLPQIHAVSSTSPGAVYALYMNGEYRLTRTVNGPGSVSGADGFYSAGSMLQLTATASAGSQFAGWSGSADGMSNPLSLRMDGPNTAIANFTVPAGAAVETLSPLVGSGSGGTFTATFSHGGGANQLYLGYILFLPTPNVVNYVATGSCLVEYNRISHGMRLIDDPGTGWLGPISGVVISPTAGTLTNNQCTVNIAGSSASISGNTMTMTVPVTFKGAVTPIMGTFLQALDVKGDWTGMTQFGNRSGIRGAVERAPRDVSLERYAADDALAEPGRPRDDTVGPVCTDEEARTDEVRADACCHAGVHGLRHRSRRLRRGTLPRRPPPARRDGGRAVAAASSR